MKVAVSIPDDVFDGADCRARRLETSRSRLHSRAISEFLARHAPDQVTKAMNRVCDVTGTELDLFMRAAVRSVVERSEW